MTVGDKNGVQDPNASCPLVGCSKREGAVNFRDMAEVWSSTLKEGRVYRSSQFYSQKTIKEKGIATILDLRRLKDCCKKATDTSAHAPRGCQVCWRDWQNAGVAAPVVLHVDLISTALKMYIVAKMPCKMWWDVAKTVYKGKDPASIMCPAIANNDIFGFKWFYSAILDRSKENIAKALRVFADPCNYPILIHCVHGKDRTGLIAMLLLALCGVPRTPIVTDYAESDRELRKGKEANELQMADYLQHDSVIAALPKDGEAVLQHIDEKYGNIVGYMRNIGLTEIEIQRIRMNMLMESKLVHIPRKRRQRPALATPLYPMQDCESEWLPTSNSADALSEFVPDHSVAVQKPLLRHTSSVPDLRLEDLENLDGLET